MIPLSRRARLRLQRRFRRRSMVTVKRGALVSTGCTLMAVGILSVPSPLPIGFVLIVIGMAITAQGSKSAGRGFTWIRRRVPRLSHGLNRLKPRMPAAVRRFIEKSDPK